MAKTIIQEKVKIIANQKIGGDFLKLTLGSAKIAAAAQPGEFVQIKVSDAVDPLLRRPLGIHGVKNHTFDCLVQIIGPATKILSEKKSGDFLDVIGPLGNGFDYSSCVMRHASCVLVAGGMGVAPLLFLAEEIKKRTTHNAQRKTLVLIGAKTKNHILCEKEFKKLGCDVRIATDDGSGGFKGRVTELLAIILRTTHKAGHTTLYACGPSLMLKEISRISYKQKIPAQISLEAHMCCGIGACLGCVVKTKEGFKRVCKEGPVFEAREIVWD